MATYIGIIGAVVQFQVWTCGKQWIATDGIIVEFCVAADIDVINPAVDACAADW